MNSKTLIILAGPTSVGKTSLGINLARFFKTEIVSADSRQIYNEMRIGTAVPDQDQLRSVPHHLIQYRPISQYYNASMFEQDALTVLKVIFSKHPTAILVGGSGLYIDAICYGIDELPPVDQEIREKLKQKFRDEGIESLRFDLKRLDPDYYDNVDLHNHKRILKALEISLITGKPYSSFLKKKKMNRYFNMIKIGLDLPREELYSRINMRVDKMISEGLLEEARSLYPDKQQNALKTVGYKELFQHLDGEISFDRAIELIKRNTRHYARRQLTWFRRYKDFKWFHPDQEEEIKAYILDHLPPVKTDGN
jgi:tRNA dimethylallyltransferase